MNYHEKIFSKIGFNYLLLAIITTIFQIIIANIVHFTNPDILNNLNYTVIISSICNYILPLPIFLYLMNKIDKRKIEKNSVNIKTFIRYIAITIILMWIGNIIGIFITNILGNVISNDISNPINDLISSSDMWLNLIVISFIAPIFEEIIFRKLLIDRTIKYGMRISIIISATLFAFFHGNLNQFFYAFLMGGFFAYIYAQTGKITYTITLHIIINFLGSVISPLLSISLQAMQTGSASIADIGFILLYIIIYLTAIIITLLTLFNYKKYKVKGTEAEITLEKPYRTIFINYGMICFIIFFLIRIIKQMIT